MSFILRDTVFWFPCHLFYFVLDPKFFFPSFWVPLSHWSSSESSLANHTGFSGDVSVISIAGKICTGRAALWRDFPAIGTLLCEASPHRFKLTFFSSLFEIHLPAIWLCPGFNSSLWHLFQGSRHFHSTQWCLFRWWEAGWVSQWPKSFPPPHGRLNFQMERHEIIKHSALNSERLSAYTGIAKVPVTTVTYLAGTVLIWNAFSIGCICICWMAFSVHTDSANTLRSSLYAETWTVPGQVCISKASSCSSKRKQGNVTGKIQGIQAKC